MSLEQIRKELPSGKWRTSRVYEDVDVAAQHHWAVSHLWALAENDQAFLIARHRAKATMEAYENHLFEKEMARKNPKAKR